MIVRRVLCAVTAVLLVAVSCSRDPEKVKKTYLDRGNQYFKNGKYKEASIMYRSALKKDMRYGEAYYHLGLTDLRLGRWADAIKNLRRAVELQPDNLDATTNLANIYLQIYMLDPKRPKEALKELELISAALLKKDPKSFLGLRIKGHLALAARNTKEALDAFRAAHQVKPLSPEIVMPLVETMAMNGEFAEGEKLAYQMIAKDKTFQAVYDWLYFRYIALKRLEDAEKIYKIKIENNPKQPFFILQLAGHYFLTRRKDDMEKALAGITSRPNDFPVGHVQVGDFYLRIRDVDKAVKHYEEGLKLAGSKEHRATYEKRLVETLILRGRKQEALDLVGKVLKANPSDNDAIAMRASLWLQDGSKEKIQNAISELNSVIIRTPENFVLRYNLGRAYIAKGDVDQARIQFQEAVKYRPDYTPARLALAQLHLAKNEFTKALQVAEEIISYDANNIPARMIRTSCRIGLGDLPTARNELNLVLAANPSYPDALFQMGVLNYQEKKYKDAEMAFVQLQKTSPNDPRGLVGRVETFVAQKQFDIAIQLLQDDLKLNPERSFYRLALGNTAVRAKKYDLAIAEYDNLMEKNAKNFDVQIRLAETHRLKGDMPQAIAAFKKARELNPNDPTALVHLALIFEGVGKSAEARPYYEMILKLQPDNVVALNNLAFLMAETGGDLDQALTMAQRAKAKAPHEANVADTLGWIYIKKNLSDSAIPIFRELVSKHEDNAIFHYHLGMALFQKGDKNAAKRSLEMALKNNPSASDEVKIKELMSRI